MAAQWEMETSKGWIDVPIKRTVGTNIQCVFEGAPMDIQFLSGIKATVKTKGKTYPARVKAPASFSPPERVPDGPSFNLAPELAAAEASLDQMNPLVVFDAMATDGAVRPKEFATIIQLEVSSALKKAALAILQKAEAGELPQQETPVPPQITSSIKPAIQRGVERLDFSHMRHLLEMLFRVMDGNKNGKIERAEFEAFFSSLSGLVANPPAAMDFAFSMVDKNGNGKLSLDEAQEVIDSVTELATMLIASVTDVAETMINDTASRDAAVQYMKILAGDDGMGEEVKCLGVCSETDINLLPGPNWYHKPGTSDDLCKEEFDKYEGEDKSQFILIDTKEKLGAELEEYLLDFSNLASRDKLAKNLEEGGDLDMLAQVFADDGSGGPKQLLVNSMKLMRESFAKFEADTGVQLYMKALEWSQGGVDEATFISQVVPMLRESQKANIERMQADPMALLQQQLDALKTAGSPVPDQQEAMIRSGFEAASPQLLPAMKRGCDRGSEYLPEYARALFRFLDIDGSGFITKKEIQLLKALLDALLHLGERACHDLSSGELKPMEGDYKDNAKELAFAIFDVLDRDGDQHLSLVEIVTFCQKLATFTLSNIRVIAHMMIECTLDELCKAFAEFGWKAAGLEEIEKEQFLPMMMMAPMAVQSMMQ